MRDKSDYYRQAPNRNPKGPLSGTRPVVRGGSLIDVDSWDFHAADRSGWNPIWRLNRLSFRYVKTP